MSVREYIGARYVPVFADPIEWDNTKAYEPLTIVTNEGNSYTSRQSVPIGVDITNTNYWALTSNYSSQIEQYRQEVAALSDEVGAFDTRIDTVEGRFPVVFDDLASDVNVNPLDGKNVVIYGDSTMTDTGSGSTALATLIANATGANVTNRAVGGTSLSGTGDHSFYTLMTNATTSDFTGFEYMLIAYGTNDWQGNMPLSSYDSGFDYYLQACIDLIKTKAPNLRPIFITPAGATRTFVVDSSNTNVNINKRGNKIKDYVNAILNACYQNHIPCIDLYHLCAIPETAMSSYFLRSGDLPDGTDIYVHYNQAFKQKIAMMVNYLFPFDVPAYPYGATPGKILTRFAINPVGQANITQVNSIETSAPATYPSLPIVKIDPATAATGIPAVLTGANTLVFAIKAGSRKIKVSVSHSGSMVRIATVEGSGVFIIPINGIINQGAKIHFENCSADIAWVCNPMLFNGYANADYIQQQSYFAAVPDAWITTSTIDHSRSLMHVGETGIDIVIYATVTSAITMGNLLLKLPVGFIGASQIVYPSTYYHQGYKFLPLISTYDTTTGAGQLLAGENLAVGDKVHINIHLTGTVAVCNTNTTIWG